MIAIGFFLTLFFLLSVLIIGIYIGVAWRINFLDHPNHRSSHQQATPRGAGLVFILLWMIALLVLFKWGYIDFSYLSILMPLVLILMVGFLDDCYPLAVKYRIFVQCVAACLSLWLMGGVSEWVLGAEHLHFNMLLSEILAFLMLLWSINLFNFMDGMDGLASIEALFVLLPLSYWILLKDGFGLSLALWVLSALILGFIVWNKPKAKVFMGDAGSSSLGFISLLFILMAQKFFEISILSSLVLYSLFIFDSTITLIRRIHHNEAWSKAHCSHAYQRLHQAGWSHARVLLGVSLINILLVLIASLMNVYPTYSLLGVAAALIILSLSYGYVEMLNPMSFREKSIGDKSKKTL